MFELIEHRAKLGIKWWTMPASVLMIFISGLGAGVLIGRRSTNFFEWLQFAFILLVASYLLSPIMREISNRTREKDIHDN